MDQLLRREFLLKVLFTIGAQALIDLSGLSRDVVTQKTLGQSEITDLEIETIYQALKQ
jgi:hypothetical protein